MFSFKTILLMVLKLLNGQDFHLKNFKDSKGHNSIKNVGGVMNLFLCTLSDDGLYLYKVS